MKWNILKTLIFVLFLGFIGYHIYGFIQHYQQENKVLKEIISRLEADSRIAEVLVTGVNFDEESGKRLTTIKFLEYDAQGNPLEPKYFTFSGNVIQFQSLVVRFQDKHVRFGDKLKGKSAFIFWKAFMLDGENTQEYVINEVNDVPAGYKIDGALTPSEERFWERFWKLALDPETAKSEGVKNAQIEAPGTMFVPGRLYMIFIEHDGGMRIEASPLSPILRGERIIS